MEMPGKTSLRYTGRSRMTKTQSPKTLFALAFGALGVVYGDIGTSPLYTVRQIFFGLGGVKPTGPNIIGAISTVLWVLTLVVTIKYVIFVLRAEYEQEGGLFALLGHLRNITAPGVAAVSVLLILGAGLLIGDGVITPAISVLSAVEGVGVLAPSLMGYIVPVTLLILVSLFAIQYRGTAAIGRVFGVVMVSWFLMIALLGLRQIAAAPGILAAANPWHALIFLWRMGPLGTMFVLGAVVLAVTGGEALFADLGHFGVGPIRLSWLVLVYPALLLNYLGQGAYLLRGLPVVNDNVFYSLVPAGLLVPAILIATAATVIASQALISGTFSLIAQGIVQNLTPNFRIVHTSYHNRGHIYVPMANWALLIGCVLLVLGFHSSTNLGSAYGFAVTGVMFATSVAMILVSRYVWRWNWLGTLAVFGLFAVLDLVFLISNSLKFVEGGYVPLSIGLTLFAVMLTWNWGRRSIGKSYADFIQSRTFTWLIDLKRRVRAAGATLTDEMGRMVEINRAIVFLRRSPYQSPDEGVSVAARLFIKRTGSVPKCMIFLQLEVQKTPELEDETRYSVFDLGSDIFAVNARYGFMEDLDVRELLKDLRERDLLPYDVSRCTIHAAEEDIIIDAGAPWLTRARGLFFKYLSQLAIPTFRYFGLGGDTNVSVVLIPIHVTAEGVNVVRLFDNDLAI